MEYVYHGSRTKGLQKIERRSSTHGKSWVYASPNKVVATIFISNGGSDLDYNLGGAGTKESPIVLVERYDGAFDKIFNTSGSLYTLNGENFNSGKTSWSAEVVSEFDEQVLEEEYINNINEKLDELAHNGELQLYRYPNRPKYIPSDNSDLIEKYIKYEEMGHCGAINDLLKRYPNLREKINKAYQNQSSNHKQVFSYQQIMDVLNLLYSDKRFQQIANIAGGIVPWVISQTNSGRKHSDIDVIVKQENMGQIRKILKEYNLYNEGSDSLSYQGEDKIDYGIETMLRGIPIGFYPYEITMNNEIVQRSFTLPTVGLTREPQLKTTVLSNVCETDYISTYQLPNGLQIKTNSLEVIRASKEETNRGKDITDIKQIDTIGIDLEKYNRIKQSVSQLRFTQVNVK